MSNTYKWDFSAFDCYPSEASQTDVVFNIHWRLTADDGAGHQADCYSTQAVKYEAGSPFTPFNALTPEQVQVWVETAMGEEQVAAHKAGLDAQIQQLVNPIQITLPAPWSA